MASNLANQAKQQSQDYRDQANFEHRIFDNHPDGILLVNLDSGEIIEANPAMETMFDRTRDSLIGERFDSFLYDDFAVQMRRAWEPEVRGAAFTLKFIMPDDELRIFDVTFSPILDNDDSVLLLCCRDAMARKHVENVLQQEAYTDALSELPNRRAFMQHLASNCDLFLQDGSNFGVVLCDIDKFKQINDVHGHEFGDKAIQFFAETLKRNIRSTDFAARFGGDEFAIIFSKTSADGITKALSNVQAQLKKNSLIKDGITIPIEVSFGIVVVTDKYHKPAELLKQADIALYESKRNGRNQYSLYSPEDQPSPDSNQA